MIPVLFLLIVLLLGGCHDKASHEPVANQELVVLLHGLARSDASMSKMARALEEAGYQTCNIDYPSTEHPIETLASRFVGPAIAACNTHNEPVHFVTHSMGGIMVRYLAKNSLVSEIGRVVMLAPPNRGSEAVDALGDLWLFEWINGPAGQQLGTDSSSVPIVLDAVDFELGVIAGNSSFSPFLSTIIEGDDDGKVSVERAQVMGMTDFLVLPVTHTFIMRDAETIRQTLHFLENGVFSETG